MSRVFVAEEMRFGRIVVIKVLTHESTAGLSAERLEREIQLAAQLQQANIVPVLGAGEIAPSTGGNVVTLPYYTMPFVDGESLRARIETGPLPFAEAVAVLRDVARALSYAHDRGVVHRDVKPENVLLSGGAAVVTDFGIAKAVSASKMRAPRDTLTVVGTSLGTPAYMAPEQAVGGDVDHRADIYSWGVVAYELLAGRHPIREQDTTAAHRRACHGAAAVARPRGGRCSASHRRARHAVSREGPSASPHLGGCTRGGGRSCMAGPSERVASSISCSIRWNINRGGACRPCGPNTGGASVREPQRRLRAAVFRGWTRR